MTHAEQIAAILDVDSTDVIVENQKSARLKDRELTEQEQELIAHIFQDEINQMVDAIADLVESGLQGQELANEIRKLRGLL